MTRSGKGPFVEPGPQLQSIRIIIKIVMMMVNIFMYDDYDDFDDYDDGDYYYYNMTMMVMIIMMTMMISFIMINES